MIVEHILAEVKSMPGKSAFHSCSTCEKVEEAIPKKLQKH